MIIQNLAETLLRCSRALVVLLFVALLDGSSAQPDPLNVQLNTVGQCLDSPDCGQTAPATMLSHLYDKQDTTLRLEQCMCHPNKGSFLYNQPIVGAPGFSRAVCVTMTYMREPELVGPDREYYRVENVDNANDFLELEPPPNCDRVELTARKPTGKCYGEEDIDCTGPPVAVGVTAEVCCCTHMGRSFQHLWHPIWDTEQCNRLDNRILVAQLGIYKLIPIVVVLILPGNRRRPPISISIRSRRLEETLGENEFVCSTGAKGDPHIKKWNGEWYDWQGECDNVLVHAPDFGGGLGLDIHIRLTSRSHYSFIETLALQIGEDVLEVGSFGDYALNGVDGAKTTGGIVPKVSGYPIYHTQENKKHRFDVVLGQGENITITTVKEIVSAEIRGAPRDAKFINWFQNSTGLMGSLDGKALARDGVTILKDPNAFGQEWQVLDSEPNLFRVKDRPPQYPEKCKLPSAVDVEKRRQLGESISWEAAEEACAHWREDEKENCIYDVMATGDLELAQA